MDNNKYAKVEGLLYSYASLPYRKKNLEIDKQLSRDDSCRLDKLNEELERLELIEIKVKNMLDYLKVDSELEYNIIYLRYIKKLDWSQVELQLNMSESQLRVRRKKAIMKLIAMV